MKIKVCIFILFLFSIMLYCGNKNEGKNQMSHLLTITDITQNDLDKLKNKTIYFGHQSVGYNIIDGINGILKGLNYNINILEITKIDEIKVNFFNHSKNGKNRNPKSKVDSFVDFINNGGGKKLGIAFFKFCYVDIDKDSDIDSIFQYYKKNINELIKKFPKVKFIHFTTPVTTYKHLELSAKIKDMVKSFTGKETYLDKIKKDNIKRNIYNNLLRAEYKKEDIFDLAAIESLNIEGKKEEFLHNGERYGILVSEYSYDGGHLNELGRVIVANAFLKYLVKL